MHGDEANQAVKTGILLEDGEYIYDPRDHHGPTLYYLALIPAKLSGADSLADLTEPMLRVVPALFGVALILLLWFVRDGLGNAAANWAAVFTAVSPAFVFYSRYYIQEMLLVFFTLAALAAGWRYVVQPLWPKALLFGACLGLMHATKETAVLAWA
ncbi:MAG: glycosyltransferase family 39 protein, partial [Candidatus Hydrogenedentales bacterium]